MEVVCLGYVPSFWKHGGSAIGSTALRKTGLLLCDWVTESGHAVGGLPLVVSHVETHLFL